MLDFLVRVSGSLAGRILAAIERHYGAFGDLPTFEPVTSAMCDDEDTEWKSWLMYAKDLEQDFFDGLAALPREERPFEAAAALWDLDEALDGFEEPKGLAA